MNDLATTYGPELSELFAHSPSEFDLVAGELSWESPCWLDADIILKPRSEAARAKFLSGLRMAHHWDAFAKTSWENQVWAVFIPRYQKIEGPFADAWRSALFRCFQTLTHQIQQTESLFPQPFRLYKRQEYTAVNLATIVKEDPETLSVYLVCERRPHQNYGFLRIHSPPPFRGRQPRCLWFDKRLPPNVTVEDVLPWFVATLHRLPRRDQPAQMERWTNRLLYFEPQLAPAQFQPGKPWGSRPKVVLVFGPTAKVGYRGMSHLERQDISQIVRRNDVLTITGKTRHRFADQTPIELEETFHLLVIDEVAAQKVEQEILYGGKIHFGLDGQILGMISHCADVIHAINAPLDMIRKLCLRPGLELNLMSPPREKHKMYFIVESQLKASLE